MQLTTYLSVVSASQDVRHPFRLLCVFVHADTLLFPTPQTGAKCFTLAS